MNLEYEHRLQITRREFLGRAGTGLGLAALAGLLGRAGTLAATASAGGQPRLPGLPHVAPKAKRVIYLFQNGAPTHVDLFDYKPKLQQDHGKPVPDEDKRYLVRGPEEIDLVNSGLEETMVTAYRSIRDVHHTRVPKESMRTAAFIIAIKKVSLAYEQLGIFP